MKTIEQMAEEAELRGLGIDRFAALVRAQAIEEAAQVAIDLFGHSDVPGFALVGKGIAEKIRGLTSK